MLNVSEMASLLGCSESRLVRNTKYYIGKITDLGYEKVGKGKSMIFEESNTSLERQEYLKLLDLVDGNETFLNNLLDFIEEVIDMAGLKTDIEGLSERLGWSQTKVRSYVKALEENDVLKKIKPSYYGIKFNGEKEEITFDTYDLIQKQIDKGLVGAKNGIFVREMILSVHGYKNIKKYYGWTFSDKTLESEEFLRTLLLALDYRKGVKKNAE